MSAAKIKTLIILILLLINVFLLALVVPTALENSRREQQADAALTALYQNAGVTLRPEDIPETEMLYPLELSVPEYMGLNAARTLLGETLLTQADGQNTRFTSALGEAAFSPDGSFSARIQSAAVPDPEAETRRLLDAMGISYASVHLETLGSTVTCSAVLTVDGSPILTHSLTFRYESGCLASVSGLLLPVSKPTRTGAQSTVSARDALVAFLGSRMATGWLGSRMGSVTQGYALTQDASQDLWQLQPAWHLATDSGAYLMDGTTKIITAVP